MERHFSKFHAVIEGVDWLRRPNSPPLLIKLKVEAVDRSGRTLERVVVLRGDAVGILVVLKNRERGDQLLMVSQARLAVGEPALLEIPAGIVDEGETPLEVAVRELAEETGLTAMPNELVNLLPNHPNGFYNSVGLLDERLYLYSWERETTTQELDQLEGRKEGVEEEQEQLILHLVQADSSAALFDSKGLLAWLLWRENQRGER